MKFGKQILRESNLNPGLYYINFKRLKKILKSLRNAYLKGVWELVVSLNKQFYVVLMEEICRVEWPYKALLSEIDDLKKHLMVSFPSMDVDVDPDMLSNLKFEQLLERFQYANYSEDFHALCLNLGKMSTQCKALRKYVIWNSIAIVKIIKKKNKWLGKDTLPGAEASEILSKQNWFRSEELPRMISAVETTIEAVMVRLTAKLPLRECYTCPICLDLIVDPVILKGCSHRFCWNCLAHAAVSAQEVGQELERCPYCRSRCFNLNPEGFVIDGILSRFLRRYFPEDTELRAADSMVEREALISTYNHQKAERHFEMLLNAAVSKASSGRKYGWAERQGNEKVKHGDSKAASKDLDDELLKEAVHCFLLNLSNDEVAEKNHEWERTPVGTWDLDFSQCVEEADISEDPLLAYCYKQLNQNAVVDNNDYVDMLTNASLQFLGKPSRAGLNDIGIKDAKEDSRWQLSDLQCVDFDGVASKDNSEWAIATDEGEWIQGLRRFCETMKCVKIACPLQKDCSSEFSKTSNKAQETLTNIVEDNDTELHMSIPAGDAPLPQSQQPGLLPTPSAAPKRLSTAFALARQNSAARKKYGKGKMAARAASVTV